MTPLRSPTRPLVSRSSTAAPDIPKRCSQISLKRVPLAFAPATATCMLFVTNTPGVWKRSQGELDEALAFCREARDVLEASGESEAIAGITNNVGSILYDLGGR